MKTPSLEQSSYAFSSPGNAANSDRKGIIPFLLIAFGSAWLIWEIVIRFGRIPVTTPMFQIAAFPAAFAPALAAFIVRKWITHEGFADAGLQLNLRKWRYYVVAWLLPLVVVGCIAATSLLFGLGKPDFSFARGINYVIQARGSASPLLPVVLRHPLLPIATWLILAIVVMPIHFGEEFGWRGYLQLRLFPQRPVLSAIITGLIWAIWHYPVTFRGYDFPDHPIIGSLVVFPIATIFLSIVFGWLRLKTGSIWSSSLAHSATNVIGGSLLFYLFGGGLNSLFFWYGGILAWIPLGALSAWIVFTGQLTPAKTSNPQTTISPVIPLRSTFAVGRSSPLEN